MGTAAERQVSGSIAVSALLYVQRAAGEDALQQVVEAAGLTAPIAVLMDESIWWSLEETLALAHAAASVCGISGIGFRAGEETFRRTMTRVGGDFIRATGGPEEAVAAIAAFSAQMSGNREVAVVSSRPGQVVLHAQTSVEFTDTFYCDAFAGFCAQLPGLFGSGTGTVIEPECGSRGDAECVFIVRWDPASITPTGEEGYAASRLATEMSVAAFEQWQVQSVRLASAGDLDELLQRILDGAASIVMAPAFILDVSIGGLAYRRALGAESDAPPSPDTAGWTALSVPVTSGRSDYGTLRALYPATAAAREPDERSLTAFAAYAAAALDNLLLREQAERSHAIASALLALGRRLSSVASTKDVCDRLVAAVPSLVGGRDASVWLWEDGGATLARHARSSGALVQTPGRLMSDDLADLVPHDLTAETRVLDLATAPPALAAVMRHAGLVRCAVVPITARGAALGVLTVGFVTAGPPDNTDLSLLLRGVADLGATALDNALLVDTIREQTYLDALTGLPNRTLVEDRAERAIRRAARTGSSVALLFFDLDGFKAINDSLGHRAGDALIQALSARVSEQIRDEDTLARVGGDEFVVLVPAIANEAAAVLVGDKLLAAIAGPVDLHGTTVSIGASLGIALYPRDGTDYDGLFHHADVEMYAVKRRNGTGRQAAVTLP